MEHLKAKIVEQIVYDGVLGFSHGWGETCRRLVIPNVGEKRDKDRNYRGLALTAHGGNFYIIYDYSFSAQDVIGEIEIPDDLERRARKFNLIRESLLETVNGLVADNG